MCPVTEKNKMIDFQKILYVIIAIGFISTLLAGKRQLSVGFFIATILLATGYRRVFLTDRLEIHPSEILYWFLAAIVLFRRTARNEEKRDSFRVPKWMIFFMFFWIWGWTSSLLLSNLPFDFIFNQFKPFLILPIIFWLSWKLLKEPEGLYIFLRAMFTAGSIVGGLGIFEYYLPGVAGSIPGFAASALTTVDYMGFTRAHFSFYGAPSATFMLVITAPLGLALWHKADLLSKKFFLMTGVALQFLGVYIGGYRSIWLTIGIEVILFIMIYRGVFVGMLGLIPLTFIYQSLPNEALLRLSTLFAAASGHAVDSSAIDRINRIDEAFFIVKNNPFGLGWGTSGWVHSDLMQIAVALGVIPILIFIGGYLLLLFRLVKKTFLLRNMRAKAEFQISLGVLLGFIGSGFLFAVQGITWMVFLVLPAWLIWALAEHWTTEPPIVNLLESVNAAQNIRTTPRFQQRRYSARNPRSRPLG